ncbi:MAG: hypothetical protein ACTFAK_11865 [Candidatus Electronema sp. VV]
MAAEKISPSGCPMGKTAKMFRCFSLLGGLFYVDAAINGIGSLSGGSGRGGVTEQGLNNYLLFITQVVTYKS